MSEFPKLRVPLWMLKGCVEPLSRRDSYREPPALTSTAGSLLHLRGLAQGHRPCLTLSYSICVLYWQHEEFGRKTCTWVVGAEHHCIASGIGVGNRDDVNG